MDLLRSLAEQGGEIVVHEDAFETTFNSAEVAAARSNGLIESSSSSGWGTHEGLRLTVKGWAALGVNPPARNLGLLDLLKRLWPKRSVPTP